MINLRPVWNSSTAGLEASGCEGAAGTIDSTDGSRHSLDLDVRRSLNESYKEALRYLYQSRIWYELHDHFHAKWNSPVNSASITVGAVLPCLK